MGEATVRKYVRRHKREMGINGREVFVPKSYALGKKGKWTGSKRHLFGWALVHVAVFRHAEHGERRSLSPATQRFPRHRTKTRMSGVNYFSAGRSDFAEPTEHRERGISVRPPQYRVGRS